MDEQELKLKVWDHLRSQKVAERRQSYVQSLRGQGTVTVLLEPPAGSRVQVSGDRGFSRGAKDAPVTIVEFSDFQCPYCKTATATLKQLLDKYPGKVRLVFRDFPLVSLHPQAPKAHEAARCAGDQGKFWEYHDLLFERSPKMSPQDLKQYAQDLKLDAAAFASCLDGGKYTAEVDRDTQEGAGLGLTGTPSFFVNGRQLVGAQPIAAFQRLVDGELAKQAAKQ
jgi:protein-disulfide isomerase